MERLELEHILINKIYAHETIANELQELEIEAMDNVIFEDYSIGLLSFKAKSKTAKIHYAAKIVHNGNATLYLDPLSLREGTFEGIIIDNVVSSRWSKSRVENLESINFSYLNFYDSKYIYYNMVTSLEQKGSKIYNINSIGAINLLESEKRYGLQRIIQKH